jgi:N-acetylglutamate synthase-like GNAT family acetyltransferase
MKTTDLIKPSLVQAEPVLAVSDIIQTVNYYHEVLGFPEKWTWGEPPDHGGVTWNGAAFMQFSLDPERAKLAHGQSVWIRVRHLELLFEMHKNNKVEITFPLANRPWGFTDYTIRDINGYYITFSEPIDGKKKVETFPSTVVFSSRIPSIDDIRRLSQAVGWQPSSNAAIIKQIESAVSFVVAENLETNEIVGCAFLLGDNKTCYYIKDVIVHPDWQGRRIGTGLVQALMDWLETNGAENATVGLFTGDHTAPFYKQFGFTQATGFYKQVRRKVRT